MTETFSMWLPGTIAVLAGSSFGFAAFFSSRRRTNTENSGNLSHAGGLRDDVQEEHDLRIRKDTVVASLRELELQRDDLAPAVYTAEKRELEETGVRLLRELASIMATATRNRGPQAASAPVTAPPGAVGFLAAHPKVQGALIGLAIAMLPALIFAYVATRNSDVAQGPTLDGQNDNSVNAQIYAEMRSLMTRLGENPTDIEALLRGGQLMLEAERLPEARKFTERALQVDPESAKVQLLHAELLAYEGNTTSAMTRIDSTLANNPKMPDAWLVRATIAERAGDIDKQRESLKRFLEISDLAPDDPRRERILAAIHQTSAPEPASASGDWH